MNTQSIPKKGDEEVKEVEVFHTQRTGDDEDTVRTPEYFRHRGFSRFPVVHDNTGAFSALSVFAAGQVIAAMPVYNEEEVGGGIKATNALHISNHPRNPEQKCLEGRDV